MGITKKIIAAFTENTGPAVKYPLIHTLVFRINKTQYSLKHNYSLNLSLIIIDRIPITCKCTILTS